MNKFCGSFVLPVRETYTCSTENPELGMLTQLWVLGGTCVSLVTSHCHSVGLNSWLAVQSKACISTAKYALSPLRLVLYMTV